MDEYAYDAMTSSAAKTTSGISNVAQIPRELDRQQMAVIELHEMLSVVEDRLSPIRLPKQEPNAIDRDTPEPVRADLAQAIASGTLQIENATRRLQKILNELEI